MRTMKSSFWLLLLGVLVGLGVQRAWATITVASGSAAAANGILQLNQASGTCTVQNITAGSKICVGPGANMFWSQDTNGNLSAGSGAAYVASATPFTLSSLAINAVLPASATTIYGGAALPAHAFTVTALRDYVSVDGAGGLLGDVKFRITDGTNTCDCPQNCNPGTGPSRAATCSGTGGSGCVFPANALLTYSFIIGGCSPSPKMLNVDIEGKWQ